MRVRRSTAGRLAALLLVLAVGLLSQLGLADSGRDFSAGPDASIVLAGGMADLPPISRDEDPPLGPVAKPRPPTSVAVLLSCLAALLVLAVRRPASAPRPHTGPAAVVSGAVLLTRLCVCRP
jgi:hypothetical protein